MARLAHRASAAPARASSTPSTGCQGKLQEPPLPSPAAGLAKGDTAGPAEGLAVAAGAGAGVGEAAGSGVGEASVVGYWALR